MFTHPLPSLPTNALTHASSALPKEGDFVVLPTVRKETAKETANLASWHGFLAHGVPCESSEGTNVSDPDPDSFVPSDEWAPVTIMVRHAMRTFGSSWPTEFPSVAVAPYTASYEDDDEYSGVLRTQENRMPDSVVLEKTRDVYMEGCEDISEDEDGYDSI